MKFNGKMGHKGGRNWIY